MNGVNNIEMSVFESDSQIGDRLHWRRRTCEKYGYR